MIEPADPIVTLRLAIEGRVQGVGYRETMRAVAGRHGVVGWVRNRLDGTVEAVVQGKEECVAQVVAWCHRGPPGANVTRVHAEPMQTAERFFSFSRLPSF